MPIRPTNRLCKPSLFVVVLMFSVRNRQDTEWRSVEQRVPVMWPACHLGGRRAWFRCSAYSNERDGPLSGPTPLLLDHGNRDPVFQNVVEIGHTVLDHGVETLMRPFRSRSS